MLTDSIGQLLAAAQPGQPALRAPDCEALTYGDLQAQVARWTEALKASGFTPHHRLAVVLDNGPAMAAAFIGVASYCVCAPLNPGFSQAEFTFYLDDLNADALLVASAEEGPSVAAAHALDLPVIYLEAEASNTAGALKLTNLPARASAPRCGTEADGCALLLHTSGTTSKPKLVPLSQSNLLASAHAVADGLALQPSDAALNVMPLFHIHGLVGVLLASLAAGASVICTGGFEPDAFCAQLERSGVTWYSAVPTIHQAALEAWGAGRSAPNLRLIRSSSAALPPVVLDRLETAFGAPVIEAYGMTEAAHQMSSNPLPPHPRKAGSVGLAAGPEVCVIDAAGERLASGEIGEIAIRGPNVTAGYLDNAAANADAFTQGWFRTGDQGYQDPDGYFFLTGRLKEIINRAGEKVSPREVDEVLLEHEQVAQAVTFARPHDSLGEDVLAAVVRRDGATVDEPALRSFALDRLAAHKVPSQIIFVHDIPKGPTGKLQRIGLHKQLEAHLGAAHAEPEGELEAALAAFWSDALGGVAVGRDDNFFYLGGDSLRAARVMACILETYDVAVPAPKLFEHPTVRSLAVEVERALQERLDELAAFVDGLSDEEVARMLADDGGTSV